MLPIWDCLIEAPKSGYGDFILHCGGENGAKTSEIKLKDIFHQRFVVTNKKKSPPYQRGLGGCIKRNTEEKSNFGEYECRPRDGHNLPNTEELGRGKNTTNAGCVFLKHDFDNNYAFMKISITYR